MYTIRVHISREGFKMEHSVDIAEFAAAFCKAQGAFEDVLKNAEVKTGSYNFKYATLDAIISSVRPALASNNLSFMQSLIDGANGSGVETLIIHASGQWIKSFHPIKIVKNDNQGLGSALTYGRRYAISALLGIAVDSDDDGNEGDGKKIESVTVKKSPAGISAVRVGVSEFMKNLDACGDADSLDIYLDTPEAKKFAVKVCAEFPDLWVAADGAGLRGLVLNVAQRLNVEASGQTWLARVEKAAK